MNDSLVIRFSRSIIFKVILVLTVSVTLIVTGNTIFMDKKQTRLMLDWNFNNNEAQLNQTMNIAVKEMQQFGEKLALLSKSSELKDMQPAEAAGYLKSYTVSSLFISGEVVRAYNQEDSLICDNSMVGVSSEFSYPIEFSRITPHHPYMTPWFKDSTSLHQRIFGIGIDNRIVGDGSLVATFSFKRIAKHLQNKIGRNGFVVAINSQGEILYHPDAKKWLNGHHFISEMGLDKINPKTFDIQKAEYHTLNDGITYLTNYKYESNYDFALFSFQPKSEIDDLVKASSMGNWVLLVSSLLMIFGLAIWMFVRVGVPLNHLTFHILDIVEDKKKMEEIPEKKRRDEIGMLTRAFNAMIKTISRQLLELEKYSKSLEEEVAARTKELRAANEKLDMISRTDDLTGLPNRRDMNESIEHEIARTLRSNKPFSFIFADIDHFKNINDTYGHACGDVILKSVAQTIRGLLRKSDIFARYGGEEFLTLLPETDLTGAAGVAERFRQQIENMTVHYADYAINITITLGVAQFDRKLGADRSIQLADRALYQGKESGRNRVVAWQPEWTTEADYQAAAAEIRKNEEMQGSHL